MDGFNVLLCWAVISFFPPWMCILELGSDAAVGFRLFFHLVDGVISGGSLDINGMELFEKTICFLVVHGTRLKVSSGYGGKKLAASPDLLR